MAVLTAEDLRRVRNGMEKEFPGAVVWSKSEINAAAQAVEDFIEANKVQIGTDIETAAPTVFTSAQKKKLGAYYFLVKFDLDKV